MRKKKIGLDDFYSKYGHIAPNILDSPVQYRAGSMLGGRLGLGMCHRYLHIMVFTQPCLP